MPGVTTAYQYGIHSARPAASAGCILYACSTHSLIYRSDGSAWTTWMTIGTSTTSVATDPIWDAAGDLVVGSGADTAARLATANSSQLGTDGSGVVGWKALPVFGTSSLGSGFGTTNTAMQDTGLSVTMTTLARRVRLSVRGLAKTNQAGGGIIYMTYGVDGTDDANWWGPHVSVASQDDDTISMPYMTAVLSAGSHTFKLRIASPGGGNTVTIESGAVLMAEETHFIA